MLASRRDKDRSRPPGSVQGHQTESEGSPDGVRRGAPRGAAIVQRRALSEVDCSTDRVPIEVTRRVQRLHGASAAPRNAELARRTPSGAKNGSCAVQLLSSMAPRPRLAPEKRPRSSVRHPCELSRVKSLMMTPINASKSRSAGRLLLRSQAEIDPLLHHRRMAQASRGVPRTTRNQR